MQRVPHARLHLPVKGLRRESFTVPRENCSEFTASRLHHSRTGCFTTEPPGTFSISMEIFPGKDPGSFVPIVPSSMVKDHRAFKKGTEGDSCQGHRGG